MFTWRIEARKPKRRGPAAAESPGAVRRGFTLIELLIVVGILIILAAIGLPNFLAAQIRAKYARAVAELRTVATALETYAVDHNHYPLNTRYNNYSVPMSLTTPVAYITTGRLRDPFTRIFSVAPGDPNAEIINTGDRPDDVQLYTYQSVMDLETADYFASARYAPEFPYEPPADAIDAFGYNPGAFQRYGRWKLVSFGPDGVYYDPSKDLMLNLILTTFDIPYDPTNGAISFGNIYRTQRASDGSGTMKGK